MSQPTKSFSQVYDQIYATLGYEPDSSGMKQSAISNRMVQIGINRAIDTAEFANMFAPGAKDWSIGHTFAFANLVDEIPSAGGTAAGSGTSLYDTYRNIIRGANTTSNPTEVQKKRYADAKALLFDTISEVDNPEYEEDSDDPTVPEKICFVVPSKLYKGYLVAKQAYDSAVVGFYSNKELNAVDWNSVAAQAIIKKLKNKIDNARQALEIAGKAQVEAALATMDTSINSCVALAISDAKGYLDSSKYTDLNTQKDFGVTYAIPSVNLWDEVSLEDKMEAEIEGARTASNAKIARMREELLELEKALNTAKAKGNETSIEKAAEKVEKKKENIEDAQSKLTDKIDEITDKYEGKLSGKVSLFSSFEFDSSSYKEKKHKEDSSYKAGAAASWGLWSAKSDVEVTKGFTSFDAETSKVKITGKIATVKIVRPWFDPTIFKMKDWVTDGIDCVSTGDPKNPGKSVLLMYTTSLVLVKDLAIESKFDTEHNEKSTITTKVSVEVGYGPFKFKGNYGNSKETSTIEKIGNGYKITNKGIQVIGFINEVVPKFPR
ncbi:MAG: hypothetical protein LBU89_08500 [Fibromonadaceae bacterium]|jgi:hypothetical protein|nr:hypothetical protein [Fibromonadaceae bacterium]